MGLPWRCGIVKSGLVFPIVKDKCKASDTREFRQESGQMKKGCRCTVVLTAAFPQEILKFKIIEKG
jgi:hypothetical protein